MQKTIEFIAPVPYTGYVLYSVSRVVKNVIPEGGIILPDETQTVTRNRVSNIVTFWKDDFLFYGNKGWEHNHVGLKIHTKLDCIDVIWKRGEKVAEVVEPKLVVSNAPNRVIRDKNGKHFFSFDGDYSVDEDNFVYDVPEGAEQVTWIKGSGTYCAWKNKGTVVSSMWVKDGEWERAANITLSDYLREFKDCVELIWAKPDDVIDIDYSIFSGAFSGIGVDKPAAEIEMFGTVEPKQPHFDFSEINFDFEMPPVEPESHEVEFLDVLTFLTKATLEGKQKQIIINLLNKA